MTTAIAKQQMTFCPGNASEATEIAGTAFKGLATDAQMTALMVHPAGGLNPTTREDARPQQRTPCRLPS